MLGALFKSSPCGHVQLLFDKRLRHLLHIGLGVAMRRSAMDVVSVLRMRENKDADVGQRAKVNKLSDLVLDASHVDGVVDYQLEKA